MSLEQMTDAFNQIRANRIGLDEMFRRLSWLVDNEVPDEWEEIGQDFSEDIVSDPKDKERRFYYLDQRDFEMFRIFWKYVLELKKAEEKKENV